MTAKHPDWRVAPTDWGEAVADIRGPQIVVAGPGTGKTEFLVKRAAHLILAEGLRSDQLLVLTFSRRAAANLRMRIADRLDRSMVPVEAMTFHSLAFRLLEAHSHDALGWSQLPTLLTGPEQVDLIGSLLATEEPERWPLPFRPLLTSYTFAQEVTDFFLRAQERQLDSSELAKAASGRDAWRGLAQFLDRYHAHLKSTHRIDYGTLQAQAVRLLEQEAVAAEVARQTRFILIDEYQDTTPAQVSMLQALYRSHRNLTVAADPYQSVYGFRGTDPTNVKEFPKQFPDASDRPARRLMLTQSFRVPKAILQASERLAAAGRLPTEAGPVTPTDQAGRVEVHIFDQQSQEADWIAAQVHRLRLEEGTAYDRVAVLVRTKRRLLTELSRALGRRSIPHDPPGRRLLDHPGAQLIMDLVRAATSRRLEQERALRRLMVGPLFELSLGRHRELTRLRSLGSPWGDVVKDHLTNGQALARLLTDTDWATEKPAAEGFWKLWTGLPQFDLLISQPERADFRAAWASLSQSLDRFSDRDPRATLVDYLRLSEQEEFEAEPLLSHRSETSGVVLTTLHQAKGLEFDVVFLADAVEGVFPDLRRYRSLLHPELLEQDAVPSEGRKLAEELRLAYMAMTRARLRVVWTATSAGIEESGERPSRFLPTVAGVDSVEVLPGPPPRSDNPITPLEAESLLRRLLTDPAAPASRRLAAAAILVERPNDTVRPVSSFSGTRTPGPDDGLLGGELRLSPSQASSFEACPRRFAMERLVGIGHTTSLHMKFGSVIHDVLEVVERAALDRGDHRSAVAEAIEVAELHIDEEDFGGGAWQEAWKRRAVKLLRRLYENWPRPDGRPVLLEHPLQLKIAGVPWRGRADRIETAGDEVLRVVDYKTTTSAPAVGEAAESVQLGFYLLAALNDEKVLGHGQPREAEFWYPLAGTRGTTRRLEADRLADLHDKLMRLTRAIRREHWVPVVSQNCERCSVRIICPAWPEGREAYGA